jgi:hypothetical protein
MIEQPDEIEVRYLLAFAYVATGAFDSAIYILISTGLPDTVLNDQMRSTAELEAFITLEDALIGAGRPETIELGLSLAGTGTGDGLWWGDIGWGSLFKGCNLAILGRHEDALKVLPGIKESSRLRRDPWLRDARCFKQYAEEPVYLDVLKDQEERRARLREKLPATLAEFGVELWPQSNK